MDKEKLLLNPREPDPSKWEMATIDKDGKVTPLKEETGEHR